MNVSSAKLINCLDYKDTSKSRVRRFHFIGSALNINRFYVPQHYWAREIDKICS